TYLGLPATGHAGRQGSGAGPDQLLRAICIDQPLSSDTHACAGEGVETVAGGAGPPRRALRMHPVRLLLDLVPELLVESRALSGTGRTPAVVPVACGQPR